MDVEAREMLWNEEKCSFPTARLKYDGKTREVLWNNDGNR